MAELTIFIHGIGSNKEAWDKFITVLNEDIETNDCKKYTQNITNIENNNYYYLHEYNSKITKLPKLIKDIIEKITGRIDSGDISINKHSEALLSYIEMHSTKFSAIHIVAHSMGGIIAMKMLFNLVHTENTLIEKITKCLLYGVPLKGSNDPNELNKVPGITLSTEILNELKPNSLTINSLAQDIEQNSKILKNQVDITYIAGIADSRIIEIDREYAQKFGVFKSIAGGHSEIITPNSLSDDSFVILKDKIFSTKKKAFPTINQPNLTLKKISSDKNIEKLNYKNSFIPFMGREKEISDLNKFIDNQSKFSWQVVYESGGSGKSRLAFEFSIRIMNDNKRNIKAGFYDLSDSFDWNNWEPQYDIFIVIDYAGDKPKEILKILKILVNKEDTFDYKVRLLLLERDLEYPVDWYKDLSEGSGNINNEYMNSEPIGLSSLNDDNLYTIAKTFNKNINIEKKDFIQKLETIDSKKRPLFAALLGEEILNFVNTTEINKYNMLNNYIDRTFKNYWQDIDEKYFTLATIITINSKIKTTELVLNNKEYLPADKEFDTESLKSILVDSNQDYYTAIQPDIIGEFFILEYLNHNNKLFHKYGTPKVIDEKIDFVINYILNQSNFQTVKFINRCLQDFFTHASIQILVQRIIKIHKDEKSNELSSNIAYSFIYFNVENENLQEAKKIFNFLKELLELFPANGVIVGNIIRSYKCLINYYIKNSFDETKKLIYEMNIFSLSYFMNKNIILEVVKGNFLFLNTCYKNNSFFDSTKIPFNFLIGIINFKIEIFEKLYMNDENISMYIVFIKNILIQYLLKTNYISALYKEYTSIKNIYSHHPKNKDIAILVAINSNRLIHFHLEKNEYQQAEDIFKYLKDHTFKHKNNEEIALSFVNSTIPFIHKYINSFTKAEIKFNYLKELSNQYHNNENIALTVCMGSFNFINACIIYNNYREKALEVFSFQKSIASKFPNNKEIAMSINKSYININGGINIGDAVEE